MKTLKFLPMIAVVLLTFNACSGDDGPNLVPVEAELVSNLFAPQVGGQGQGPVSGDFTRFSFATGMQTVSETEWDIAFRGTKIIINGGESQGTTDEPERNGNAAAYIEENTFSDVNEVDESLFVQDSQAALAITATSDLGWYNYNFMTNVVSPISGRVLVFRTRDGRYAKVDIVSYYLDNPVNPVGVGQNSDTPRYYTFNYVYQPNEGITTFE